MAAPTLVLPGPAPSSRVLHGCRSRPAARPGAGSRAPSAGAALPPAPAAHHRHSLVPSCRAARSWDALKWASKSLCNKDDEVRLAGAGLSPSAPDGSRRGKLRAARSLARTARRPPRRARPPPCPQLHLVSVLESGLANDVVGESAADSSPDCKPDPVALQRTQDLLQKCKGEAQGGGIKNVKMTTLVSCVGGSADMVRARGAGAGWAGWPPGLWPPSACAVLAARGCSASHRLVRRTWPAC